MPSFSNDNGWCGRHCLLPHETWFTHRWASVLMSNSNAVTWCCMPKPSCALSGNSFLLWFTEVVCSAIWNAFSFFFYSPHLLLLCDVFMPIEQHVGDWNLDFNKVSGLIHTYAWWWWVIKILWIVIILYFIHLVLCLGIYGLILFENTYVQGFFLVSNKNRLCWLSQFMHFPYFHLPHR